MHRRPTSRLRRRTSISVLTVLALLACAGSAAAQAVRGTLSTEEGGAPVAGALVALVDAQGEEVRSAISDAAGRFRMAAPGAGQYALRVERVGHGTVLTAPFALAAGEERDHPLSLSVQAITLEAVRAEAERRCAPRPGGQDGLALQRVWDEARKALRSTLAAQADTVAGFEFTTFEKTYTPRGRRLIGTETERHRGLPARAFSSVPIEELAEHGFVRSYGWRMIYHGLDAEVLLSDLFLERHCFHLREGEGDEAGMIGLAFEPVQDRRRPDVQGVLWLDRRTSELRHLVFDYVGVITSGGAPAGGRVDFARTAGGLWMVRRWLLHFPVADLHIARDLPRNYRLGPAKAFKEVGGEVTSDGGNLGSE